MKSIDNIVSLSKNGRVVPVEPRADIRDISVSENEAVLLNILHVSGDVHVRVRLAGAGAKCVLNCIYLSNENNMNNIVLEVLHESKNTHSEQKIKGVATDGGQVALTGVIRIGKDAAQSVGLQHHRGILLSEKAQIAATPRLEILTDDVQCAHGSAIGALDERQVFYMMSRGIPEQTARPLLLKAFLHDIVPDDWHAVIDDWMARNV
ncbi:MAG: SufD family Fe-S cluster assembly protein [Alphaproteobacteria bacterium]|nr:SufD family Fe-S cluster assembly protein [Alphaproteobacteria bacterium]